MKMLKASGWVLIGLGLATIELMIPNIESYWDVYDYVVIILGILISLVLFKNKLKIAALFLAGLAVATALGLRLNNDSFWAVYNYAAILICFGSGLAALKK